MSKWRSTHLHLSHMMGYGQPVKRLPETMTGGDAAERLLEAIAARFVEYGCRVKKYRDVIRIYDCKNGTPDQSFEVIVCTLEECNTAYSENEYGRWMETDRQKYLALLREKGIIP